MNENIFHAPDKFRENAWIKSMDEYKAMYKKSVEDPDGFWGEIAETFYWEKKWDKVGILTTACPRGRCSLNGLKMPRPILHITVWIVIWIPGATKPL